MTMMSGGIRTQNVILAFMAMAVLSCSAPENDRDASHEVQGMLDSLYERGFDSDQVALLDQYFLIEGDMLAKPESLLSEVEASSRAVLEFGWRQTDDYAASCCASTLV